MTTLNATPLFDADIYVTTVQFSENAVPAEPLPKTSISWLPRQILNCAATVALSGFLTVTLGNVLMSHATIYPSAIAKNWLWEESPPVPAATLAAAAMKLKLFVHVPHNEGDLEHPDID